MGNNPDMNTPSMSARANAQGPIYRAVEATRPIMATLQLVTPDRTKAARTGTDSATLASASWADKRNNARHARAGATPRASQHTRSHTHTHTHKHVHIHRRTQDQEHEHNTLAK
eukprot:13005135-Alexandrium_andersonii.AAC.1